MGCRKRRSYAPFSHHVRCSASRLVGQTAFGNMIMTLIIGSIGWNSPGMMIWSRNGKPLNEWRMLIAHSLLIAVLLQVCGLIPDKHSCMELRVCSSCAVLNDVPVDFSGSSLFTRGLGF